MGGGGAGSGAHPGHPAGSDRLLAGLSTLAVVAINDTNGGLYMALMGRYGTPGHVGAYS